jgi:hypothetical protein
VILWIAESLCEEVSFEWGKNGERAVFSLDDLGGVVELESLNLRKVLETRAVASGGALMDQDFSITFCIDTTPDSPIWTVLNGLKELVGRASFRDLGVGL